MIPCNRCGVPVPQPRYSVATDRMCPACQDELREYQRNTPIDDLGDESGHICSWCFPGQPGNHGICEKHAAEMVAAAHALKAAESRKPKVQPAWVGEMERAAKRYDQIVYSVVVLLAMTGAALLIGAMIAVKQFIP